MNNRKVISVMDSPLVARGGGVYGEVLVICFHILHVKFKNEPASQPNIEADANNLSQFKFNDFWSDSSAKLSQICRNWLGITRDHFSKDFKLVFYH